MALIRINYHSVSKSNQTLKKRFKIREWPKGFCHPIRPLCTVQSTPNEEFLWVIVKKPLEISHRFFYDIQDKWSIATFLHNAYKWLYVFDILTHGYGQSACSASIILLFSDKLCSHQRPCAFWEPNGNRLFTHCA